MIRSNLPTLPVRLLVLIAFFALARGVQADNLTIAAASDLKFVMDEIVAAFAENHPDDDVEVVYGSSGRFHAQIQRGAPYDLFFSADIGYAESLHAAGHAASDVIPYARGRIVLWSTTLDASAMALEDLKDPGVRRIAIANPRHAPYGMRAEEALRSAGLWEALEDRLVFGENIAHTAQFVQTGNAQVGIIALALALSPELTRQGDYRLIPDDLHSPLEQGFIVTARAADKDLAHRFTAFMDTERAQAVMSHHGFTVPGAAN